MKCTNCEAELPENEKVCSECGTEMQAEAKPEGEATAEAEFKPAPKGGSKKVVAAIAAVAVVGAGAFGVSQMLAKDPKQIVFDAIEGVYAKGQTNPMEELFGIAQFTEHAKTTDNEMEFSLKLDDTSIQEAGAYTGSGVKFSVKNDVTNTRSAADMALIYNDMDLVTIQSYYGEDTMMTAIPELTKSVFTVNLGEGLGERIAQSPTLGPILEERGLDAGELAQYIQDTIAQEKEMKNNAGAYGQVDIDALMQRYKEGTKAQEKFKAAWTVSKGEKATFTVDGKEVSCKGYETAISKNSMMGFLRTSSDFFLQDEQLKSDYLKRLEMTARLSRLAGGDVAGTPSVEELQKQSYEELTGNVNEMLDELDKTLGDITMTVYVDKKGNLAAMDGTATLTGSTDGSSVEAAFHAEIQGGAYRTQNVTAVLTLTYQGAEATGNDVMTFDLTKQGTYDGKRLTADWNLDMNNAADGSSAGFLYTGTYNSEDGSYHVQAEVENDGEKLGALSLTGAVDQLEKGKSIHVNLDEVNVSYLGDEQYVKLGGIYSYQPLSGEISAPEGTQMDALAATEEDWQGVMMEMFMSAYGLMMKLGA